MVKTALLIGVSEYEHELNLLPAATRDVEEFQKVLQDLELGSFDEVATIHNPIPQDMREGIEDIFTDRAKNDLVLLYFSGHGIKDNKGNFHLATRTTRRHSNGRLKRASAIPAKFIHEIMNDCRAKRQVIILDCCFSGAFDPSLQTKDDGYIDLEQQLGAEGRIVLTSSNSIEYSFEHPDADLSLYTHHLIEGIKTGASDLNNDGLISVLEIHRYISKKIQEKHDNQTTPKLINLKDLGFEIILSKVKCSDSRLAYRRAILEFSILGEITTKDRPFLEKLRHQLLLTEVDAIELEKEVLSQRDNKAVSSSELTHFLEFTEDSLRFRRVLQKHWTDLVKIFLCYSIGSLYMTYISAPLWLWASFLIMAISGILFCSRATSLYFFWVLPVTSILSWLIWLLLASFYTVFFAVIHPFPILKSSTSVLLLAGEVILTLITGVLVSESSIRLETEVFYNKALIRQTFLVISSLGLSLGWKLGSWIP